jgi:hypothetical protein
MKNSILLKKLLKKSTGIRSQQIMPLLSLRLNLKKRLSLKLQRILKSKEKLENILETQRYQLSFRRLHNREK